MRLKLAIAAVLGMLLGLVPLTGVVQAGASDTANVRIVHSVLSAVGPAPAAPVDVYVDGAKAVTALAWGQFADATLPSGTHAVVLCLNPSVNASCASPVISTSVTVVADNNYTLTAIGYVPAVGASLQSFTNERTPTSYGSARIQVNNAVLSFLAAPVSVCIDGVGLAGTTNIGFGVSGFAEIPAGTHTFSIQDARLACDPAPKTIEFPAGTSWSFTLVPSGAGGAPAGNPVIQIVGEARPTNTPATSAFCTDVTTFGTASKALTGLLSTIKPGDSSTYPTAEALNTAIDGVVKVIASGDMNVPATIKPQWEILTSGLRDLVAGLQLVGGDVSKLPEASLTTIVAGINSPVKNADTEAATTVLTNWYLSNCMAAPAPADPPATPKYTG